MEPSLLVLLACSECGRVEELAGVPVTCFHCRREWSAEELVPRGVLVDELGARWNLVVGVSLEAQGQVCRVCGCTVVTPCAGGCSWVEPDLCSACALKAPASPAPRRAARSPRA